MSRSPCSSTNIFGASSSSLRRPYHGRNGRHLRSPRPDIFHAPEIPSNIGSFIPQSCSSPSRMIGIAPEEKSLRCNRTFSTLPFKATLNFSSMKFNILRRIQAMKVHRFQERRQRMEHRQWKSVVGGWSIVDGLSMNGLVIGFDTGER